jgi:prepilin-type N-terminal cleavage/methylation domain-containing protein
MSLLENGRGPATSKARTVPALQAPDREQHSVFQGPALDRTSLRFQVFRSAISMPIRRGEFAIVDGMRRGYTLFELVAAIMVMGVGVAFALPKIRSWLDWIAVERAAAELTSALAVTRNTAVLRGVRTRLSIQRDSLRLDKVKDQGWIPSGRWPGPAHQGVELAVSNPIVTFDPIGLGWGASNAKILLSRGLHIATITTSRLGRVKRW